MNYIASLLARKRLILTVVAVLSLTGAVMWVTMVRQEDPRLPDYWGQVVAPFPGADAPTVEKLILEPIEDALAEVDDIKIIEATAFDEIAVLSLELHGDTHDFDHAWDEVREALDTAQKDFPIGVDTPVLDEDQQDQDSVVLAVTGSSNRLKLLEAARQAKDKLLALSSVSKVHLIADPGEQVVIEIDDPAARRLGLSPALLADTLKARSRIIPGGSIELGGKTVRLRPLSEFQSVAEIARTPIRLPSGQSIMLSEVADVRLGAVEPASARMRFNGEISVGLAIVPQKAVNLVRFGEAVRRATADTSAAIAPLIIKEVTFQPSRTAARLLDLSRSLATGMLIVAGVLIMSMGLRMGLVATAIVPLVTLSSLALFAWNGGVLHQISIAAFVLALGMLVDNAIVVAENVQWRLDQGESQREAAVGAVSELAVPLAGATATTLAAFVPMLISQGPTAAFTRTIPIIIMLTLTVSYLFAVFVTPVLSQMLLIAHPSSGVSWIERVGKRLAGVALRRSKIVIAVTLVVIVGSMAAAGKVDQQFFPSSDRNQFIIDVKLAEGAHLDATDQTSRIIEDGLLSHPEVARVSSFIGRSAPQFYYNINRVPFSPHLAQLIVETHSRSSVKPLLAYVGSLAAQKLSGIEVIARELEQGPPVQAPIEVRLFGSRFDQLHEAAVAVASELEATSGTRDIRHDLGPGAPTIRFEVDDAAAARYGITRADLARTLFGRTRGLPVGELYMGEDPIPIIVRSSVGEHLQAEALESVDVATADGRLIPLAQLARQETAWSPAAIKHRSSLRVVTVSAQLLEGAAFSQVLKELTPRLEALKLPSTIQIAFGGDAEGSGEANSALMKSIPIGMLLLIGVLLAEFNSFKRVALILMTVPLATAGIVPGLLIVDQPFGFMSLLGVFALVGIVVNNAIVMLEVVEARRKSGASVVQAVEEAVARRIRPILLTTATTVAGLLPLAMSESTLWPPLAWAMISGLLASTLLTLIVLPAAYRLVFQKTEIRRLKTKRRPSQLPAALSHPGSISESPVVRGQYTS
jgi:multidrug efflux pump subunit AcrB